MVHLTKNGIIIENSDFQTLFHSESVSDKLDFVFNLKNALIDALVEFNRNEDSEFSGQAYYIGEFVKCLNFDFDKVKTMFESQSSDTKPQTLSNLLKNFEKLYNLANKAEKIASEIIAEFDGKKQKSKAILNFAGRIHTDFWLLLNPFNPLRLNEVVKRELKNIKRINNETSESYKDTFAAELQKLAELEVILDMTFDILQNYFSEFE